MTISLKVNNFEHLFKLRRPGLTKIFEKEIKLNLDWSKLQL